MLQTLFVQVFSRKKDSSSLSISKRRLRAQRVKRVVAMTMAFMLVMTQIMTATPALAYAMETSSGTASIMESDEAQATDDGLVDESLDDDGTQGADAAAAPSPGAASISVVDDESAVGSGEVQSANGFLFNELLDGSLNGEGNLLSLAALSSDAISPLAVVVDDEDTPALEPGKTYVADIAFKNASNLSANSSAAGYYDAKAIVEVTEAGAQVTFFQTSELARTTVYKYDSNQTDINADAALALAIERLDDDTLTRAVTVNWLDLDRSLLINMLVDRSPMPGGPFSTDMRLVLDLTAATELDGSSYFGFGFPASASEPDPEPEPDGLEPGKTYVADIAFKNASNLSANSSAAGYYDAKAIVEVTGAGAQVTFFQTSELARTTVYKYDSSQTDINADAALALAIERLNDDSLTRAVTVSWLDLDRSLLINMLVDRSPMPGGPFSTDMRLVLDLTAATELDGSSYFGFKFPAETNEVFKGDLGTLIADAEKLKSADYTSATFAAMQTELANAKMIFADAKATQSDVNGAYSNLSQAITKLVNISALKTRVAEAEKIKLADYTIESANALSTALNAAKTVLANANASNVEIAAALTALNTAMNGLISKSLDFTQVGSFYLVDVKMKMTDNLGQTSSADIFYDSKAVIEVIGTNQFRVSFFQTSEVNLVQNNSYAYDKTQSDNNTVARNLDNRVSANETGNSAGTIKRVIVEMKSIYRTLLVAYNINTGTSQSPNWVARDMRMELSFSNAKVMTDLVYLGFNFAGGVVIVPPKAVDKTALKAQIDKASAVDATPYTELSYSTLKNALDEVQQVYANANASQASVDAALGQLQAAINGLVLKPKDALSLEEMGDGRYTVHVDFWHASSDEPSMANASLNKTAIIDIRGGNMTMSISTVPIRSGSLVTALTVFTVNGSAASVIANNITIGGSSYPSAFSFPLPNRNTYQPVTFTMRPDIQVMPDGLGGRLRISWDTLQTADGAVLSSNTAVVSVDKDVSNVLRTAQEAEEEAKTPVLDNGGTTSAAGTGMSTLGEQETATSSGALTDGIMGSMSRIPWYGWTAITLGLLGACALAYTLYRHRVAPKQESVHETETD